MNLSKSNKNYFICRTKEIKLSVTLVNWSLETNSEKKKRKLKFLKYLDYKQSLLFSQVYGESKLEKNNKKQVDVNVLQRTLLVYLKTL